MIDNELENKLDKIYQLNYSFDPSI